MVACGFPRNVSSTNPDHARGKLLELKLLASSFQTDYYRPGQTDDVLLNEDPALDAPAPWREIHSIVRDSHQISDHPAGTMWRDRHSRSMRCRFGNCRVRGGGTVLGSSEMPVEVHGRQRASNMLKSGVTTARAQESKLRAAAKRDINAVMGRSPRDAIESVTVGTGDSVGVLMDPLDVAVECCEFSARRMSSMQSKWFCKYGIMEGRTVQVAAGNWTRRGVVKKIDNDGHCMLQYDGDEHTISGVRREAMLSCGSATCS